MREAPKASRGDIALKLNITETQVRTAIDYLKKENRIHHEGPAFGGSWVVNVPLLLFPFGVVSFSYRKGVKDMPFRPAIDFRSKTCCLTGHQDIVPWEEKKVLNKMWNQIARLLQEG